MPPNNNPLNALSNIQAPLLFQGLPIILDRFAWIFITAGFLLLVTGHYWRMFEAGNDGHSITRAWYKTLLILVFMMLSPNMCQWFYEGVNSIVAQSGLGTPTEVTRKCVKLAMSTPELESVFSRFSSAQQQPGPAGPDNVQRAVQEGGIWGYTKAFWFALGDEASDLGGGVKRAFNVLTDGPAMVAAFVSSLIKAVAILLSSVLMFLFLALAGIISYGLDSLRYFLLMLGAMMLPTFIAGYSTKSFSNQGHNYVTGMISLMLWPVWWMLGHIGTVGLFNAYVSLISGTSIVSSAANANFVTQFSWQNIDATVSGASTAAIAAGGLMAAGATVPFLYMGVVTLGAFGLFCWVMLVTIGGPMLGHKLVTSGASFYGGAVGGAMKAGGGAMSTGLKVAAKTTMGVGLGGAAAAGLGGGLGALADAAAGSAEGATSGAGAMGGGGGGGGGGGTTASPSVASRAAGASGQALSKASQGGRGSPASMVTAAKSAASALKANRALGMFAAASLLDTAARASDTPEALGGFDGGTSDYMAAIREQEMRALRRR
jgi:hypothetical protein